MRYGHRDAGVDVDAGVMDSKVPDNVDVQTSSDSADRTKTSGNITEQQPTTNNDHKLTSRITALLRVSFHQRQSKG